MGSIDCGAAATVDMWIVESARRRRGVAYVHVGASSGAEAGAGRTMGRTDARSRGCLRPACGTRAHRASSVLRLERRPSGPSSLAPSQTNPHSRIPQYTITILHNSQARQVAPLSRILHTFCIGVFLCALHTAYCNVNGDVRVRCGQEVDK